jgi:ubiquinone/menaquinone biosynthesis C-methylase UbiE
LAFILNNPIRHFLDPPEQLISKLNVGARDAVVDFGCGTGFLTVPLAKVAGKTTAIDISPEMLERTAAHAKRRGLTIEALRSDGTEIELESESVDLILLVHVLHEVENRSRVLSEFLRIMKPSGRLAIVEKTRGVKMFSRILGPPIIDETEVIQETERTGFTFVQTIPHGKDSIIISQKQ